MPCLGAGPVLCHVRLDHGWDRRPAPYRHHDQRHLGRFPGASPRARYRRSPYLPAPITISGRVYSDGSALFPDDALLSRAAWAVSGPGATALCTLAAQRVYSKQTVGRAELSALVWLSHCSGDFSICTDCLYLQQRFTFLNTRPMPSKWTEGVNGDLWRLVRRTDIAVSWIRSHIPRDEVLSSG